MSLIFFLPLRWKARGMLLNSVEDSQTNEMYVRSLLF